MPTRKNIEIGKPIEDYSDRAALAQDITSQLTSAYGYASIPLICQILLMAGIRIYGPPFDGVIGRLVENLFEERHTLEYSGFPLSEEGVFQIDISDYPASTTIAVDPAHWE